MEILDCTLRDGGYYTNWDFHPETVEIYLSAMEKLPIDVLEVGYRSEPKDGYLGQYFYSPINTLKQIKSLTTKKIAIILDEKDVRAHHVEKLLRPCTELVDTVRIAVNPKNFNRAIELAGAVKKLGFVVCFNVMYMSTWKDETEFIDAIGKVDGLVDYFYMVDSYGGVYPSDVREMYTLIRDRCDAKIGFHGHNNLELGLINTLTAIDCGVDIVDATITGMGRGAGNLKMELLLTVLNSRNGIEVDYNSLSEVVEVFEKLQKNYNWGTNLAYMVSGVTSSSQKDVMEWVNKYLFSFNSVILAMKNRATGKIDNQQLPRFEPGSSYDSVMIVGGGPSLEQHRQAIVKYASENPAVAIIHASAKNAKHFAGVQNDQFFCLVGNEGQRLERVFKDLGPFTGKCVLPPFPREMGTYVPPSVSTKSYELKSFTYLNGDVDSLTATAVQTAIDLKAKKAVFAGYDGYDEGNISQRERDLFLENDIIFKAVRELDLECISLLPTRYEYLAPESVYSKIV